MKYVTIAASLLFLSGCFHGVKPQQESASINPHESFEPSQQLKIIPMLDESMATLDMADFARRH